ncbi:MAG: ribonuclease R [Candidatus Vogelbacteria bacterium]|nr:ribonuclease R [Candidatus Vogelbacteria bacterium]
MDYLEGIIRISHKGVGYVSLNPSDKKSEAIEIDPHFLKTALHGDRVKVMPHPAVPGEPQTGEVVEILERKKLEFVGVLEQENGFNFLVPDDRRVYKDILIAPAKLGGAGAGDKVLVQITDWHDPKKDPIGEVVEVLGPAGSHETEMQAIVYDKGFRPGFPPAVEREAKAIKAGAAADFAAELPKRKDFRQVTTFTIDPADAKDFDDALSVRKVSAKGGPASGWEVGIHIADPAHYVLPDTALDREARKRATSIYLVDRTVPMLPEVLSNDLCSLNEGEDKLTFSAVFTFDKQLKIKKEWFGRSVINSSKRFTYESAQQHLEAKPPSGGGLASKWTADLQTLNKIALKLRADKFAAGAIAFETEEIKFELDNAGKPIRVYKKPRLDANLLIEDFMLLANRKVAEFVSKIVGNSDHRFVYRIHDRPDPEKIKQLADFLAPLGYKLKLDEGGVSAQSLNELLRSVVGRPEESMVEISVMRSMAKAVYSTKNIGHYGLAFAHYAHFTSPIRRYPDIMVHRLLDLYLQGKMPPDEMLRDYDELAVHVSQMELAAQEAERESIRYKQIEFMQSKVGQIFDGVIAGLAKWGIYIQELETLAEGMVKLFDLKDDFYLFDEKNYMMIGQRTGKRYRLGDKVRVKIVRADVKERVIDFAFV